MKYKINIDLGFEDMDRITAGNLKEVRSFMKADLKARKTNKGISIFSTDKKEDIKVMKKYIKAFDLIIPYFSVDEG